MPDGQEIYLSETRHLSFNLELGRFIMLGMARLRATNPERTTTSLVIVSSADPKLITWDTVAVPVYETRRCGTGPCPSSLDDVALGTRVTEVKYANLIDPNYESLVGSGSFQTLVYTQQGQFKGTKDISERRNFDITGKTPWLYFSLKQGTKISSGVRMDSLEIVRIPIQLNR